jgi:hypothetical protein
VTAASRPYSSRETEDVARRRHTAEQFATLDMPRPLADAMAEVLQASADVLADGRRLPREIRRACNHTVMAVGHVMAGLA